MTARMVTNRPSPPDACPWVYGLKPGSEVMMQLYVGQLGYLGLPAASERCLVCCFLGHCVSSYGIKMTLPVVARDSRAAWAAPAWSSG